MLLFGWEEGATCSFYLNYSEFPASPFDSKMKRKNVNVELAGGKSLPDACAPSNPGCSGIIRNRSGNLKPHCFQASFFHSED